MISRPRLISIFSLFILAALACQVIAPTSTPVPPTSTPTNAPPTETPTPLPHSPVSAGGENPDEPVFISGAIPYTSPFFVETLAEPFVLLEDQAGFVNRDHDFIFSLTGQDIGPVEILDDDTLRYYLSLPTVPQGTLVDVDNDDEEDKGVQVFAVAYWSNTWGGPFLEERDGTGWSGSYVSTIVNSEREGEIEGGTLVIWAPDNQQAFPTGFGEDNMLFTDDDPTAPISAGYNLVDLNEEPFRFYKEAQPVIDLNEGSIEVKDFSDMSYLEAFDAMFERVSREYPFTEEKNVDWRALEDEFRPRFSSARTGEDFYLALKDFSVAIPDAHIGLSFDEEIAPRLFFENYGGSFGLSLAELSDGRVIVTGVLFGESGDRAGIEVGAEIIEWDGQRVGEAIEETGSFFGPYSTNHTRRIDQLLFLTRYPPETDVTIRFQNPGEITPREERLTAGVEYDSLFSTIFTEDELGLPVEGEVLDDSGLGYIRIASFADDANLTARLWQRKIEQLIEVEVPGLIIDVRNNGGGFGSLARDFAGYFVDQEYEVSRQAYYNDLTEKFEYVDSIRKLSPAPLLYEGKVAVLVGPNCVSACEGFSYMMQQFGDAVVVGHYPTAGAFGEVGQGQYKMPEDLSMQFPTGRPETLDGELLIEGTGVIPDIDVPVTESSALNEVDAVLEAAVETLLDEIGR